MEVSGTVLLRNGTIVLDIPSDGYYGQYLIVGEPEEGWYRGVNQSRDSDVKANWAAVAGDFVGMWNEDGYEYLFSFRLAQRIRSSGLAAE